MIKIKDEKTTRKTSSKCPNIYLKTHESQNLDTTEHYEKETVHYLISTVSQFYKIYFIMIYEHRNLDMISHSEKWLGTAS